MNPLRDGFARIGHELRSYVRTPDLMLFSFTFPIMMFLLFSSIFADMSFGGVSAAQYYLAVMTASGVLLAGVQTLSIEIAVERHEGGLARLGHTPLRPVSYFIGKIGNAVTMCFAQTVLLFVIALLTSDASLPGDAGRWLTLAWAWLLGLACCAALGIALSALPRSARSASAVVLPIVLLLQFTSGIYMPITTLPEWMQALAGIFPLLWIGHGIRYAFLPEAFSAAEPGGQWNLTLTVIMLGAWLLAGLAISLATFRWNRGRA